MLVDIDECTRYDNVCNDRKMVCYNMPGYYSCATRQDSEHQMGGTVDSVSSSSVIECSAGRI